MNIILLCSKSCPKNCLKIQKRLIIFVKEIFFKSKNVIHKTNIDFYLQTKVNGIAQKYLKRYSQNRIKNASVIVADINTGKVLAYVGNVKLDGVNNDFYVDIAQSKRSTGSILKPFLYCSLINSGDITPYSLI